MKCPVKDCPGEMVEKTIVHTFIRHGQPLWWKGFQRKYVLPVVIQCSI